MPVSVRRIRVSHNVKLQAIRAAARKGQTVSEWVREAVLRHRSRMTKGA